MLESIHISPANMDLALIPTDYQFNYDVKVQAENIKKMQR
jgi:hypothetical protein